MQTVSAAKQPRRAVAALRATPEEEDTGIQRVAANDEAGGVTNSHYEVTSHGQGPTKAGRNPRGDAYLRAVDGNEQPNFTDGLLNSRLNTASNMLDPIDVNYSGSVEYAITGYLDELLQYDHVQYVSKETAALKHNVDSYRTGMLGARDSYHEQDEDYDAEAIAFKKMRLAEDQYYGAQRQLEDFTGQYYVGDAIGYYAQKRAEFQELAENIQLDVNRESGNWVDSVVNSGASGTLGYGDAWTAGLTSQWSTQLHGGGYTQGNQDSYFYSGGHIAGSFTFAYVAGAGLGRVDSAIHGFSSYGALAVRTGMAGYGAVQLGLHGMDTYNNGDQLSGSQQLTAVGSPIAGMISGYVGYKFIPQETLNYWHNAGAQTRASVNQFASNVWSEVAAHRISVIPYDESTLFTTPFPFRLDRVPQPQGQGAYRPATPLPRGPNGELVPSAPYPHTQLGTELGRKVGPYTTAREFGFNGVPIRDIHFTDHGRPTIPGHTIPHQHQHQHIPQPNGGTPAYGPAEPFRY